MPHSSSIVIIILLIAWMIYRRVRRTVGYQQLSRPRLRFRIGIFAVVGLLILALAFQHPIQFAYDALGLAGGLVLGYFGIRHLKFEKRGDIWFYSTHVWVQVTVLVLFLGRIAYRLLVGVQLSSSGAASAGAAAGENPAASFSHDPLTSSVFFVLVTYYIWFYGYLLRSAGKLEANPNAA